MFNQSRKRVFIFGLVVVVMAAAVFIWIQHQDTPRKACLRTAVQFQTALQSGDSKKLLEVVALPAAIADRTAVEQSEFLRKALADEISPEGLDVLQRDAEFGPLAKVFPNEASSWAAQAQVNVDDCVAFKLERNGVRAELVLIRKPGEGDAPSTYRIVRCDNVKQLAANAAMSSSTP